MMVFYFCKKCKRKWWHPIERCPYCFERLSEAESKNYKVIAEAKVFIPTLLHPKIPYYVLALEGEKGERFIFKSKKEKKVGENFEIKKRKKEEKGVAIWRVRYNFKDAIKKTFEIYNLSLSSQKKVLIIVTLRAPSYPHLGENTDPKFLEGFLESLFEKGFKESQIKIASQSFSSLPAELLASRSQLLDVAFKNLVEVFDFSKEKFMKIKKEKYIFEISQKISEFDYIFFLPAPVLKKDKIEGASFSQSFVLSQENFYGLSYLFKEKMKEVFLALFQALLEFKKKIFFLCGQERVKKSSGSVGYFNLILLSEDPLLMDEVLFQIFNPQKRDKKIQTFGREIDEVSFDFERFGP